MNEDKIEEEIKKTIELVAKINTNQKVVFDNLYKEVDSFKANTVAKRAILVDLYNTAGIYWAEHLSKEGIKPGSFKWVLSNMRFIQRIQRRVDFDFDNYTTIGITADAKVTVFKIRSDNVDSMVKTWIAIFYLKLIKDWEEIKRLFK